LNAAKVKELRAKLGLTQEEFARTVGVAYFTVVRWENQMCSPSRLAQEKLALLGEKYDNGCMDRRVEFEDECRLL
jgi:DNA-binding transcriptional regulator YiaG